MREWRIRLPAGSGMFTTLQLKPHVALSLTFLAWSGWLLEHAVGHAEMIAEHGTGFVPVGFDLDYPRPAGFFDVRELTVSVRVTTWNSGPALPTVQLVDCAIEAPGKSLVRVRLQEVCVRVVSASDLSARPGRVPGSLSILLDEDRGVDGFPDLVLRQPPRPPAGARPVGEHRQPFTIHRYACEAADQWYSEHVPVFLEASREELIAAAPESAAVAGLACPIRRVQIGLRRPFGLLETGTIETRAYETPGLVVFHHEVRTGGGMPAGYATESFPTQPVEV